MVIEYHQQVNWGVFISSNSICSSLFVLYSWTFSVTHFLITRPFMFWFIFFLSPGLSFLSFHPSLHLSPLLFFPLLLILKLSFFCHTLFSYFYTPLPPHLLFFFSSIPLFLSSTHSVLIFSLSSFPLFSPHIPSISTSLLSPFSLSHYFHLPLLPSHLPSHFYPSLLSFTWFSILAFGIFSF